MRRIIIAVDLPDGAVIDASSRETQDALKKAVHGVVGGWPNVTVTSETLSGPPWDLTAMTPQALAAVPAGRRGPKCPANQHSPGWYVGFACAHCGDVD